MDSETIRWIAGVLLAPSLLFAFIVISLLRDIKKTTDKLIEMHINADAYGFGTRAIGEYMRDMRDAFRDQSFYMKWMVKELTGKSPPPPVREIEEHGQVG